ncbi:MAG: hypothetical protein ACP5PX_03055 [Candidatus Hadarchaeum sp.]|uniref:hypothetical protein n=1 Tax=Candidatus Hadarchaeum sp. TaxID=2883567 RepID=UPI003D0CE2FC
MVLDQLRYLAFLDGRIDDAEAEHLNVTGEMVRRIKEHDIATGEIVLGGSRAYWEDLMAYNPVEVAKELSIPMLILQGGRDYQVTLEDFNGWKEGLSGRT